MSQQGQVTIEKREVKPGYYHMLQIKPFIPTSVNPDSVTLPRPPSPPLKKRSDNLWLKVAKLKGSSIPKWKQEELTNSQGNGILK